MTLWVRCLFGVILGSALTLAVHPLSRRFLFGILDATSPETISSIAGVKPAELPSPNNALNAAYWLQMASEKTVHGGSLSAKELETLIAIGREGKKIERDNAYWPQMTAVFLNAARKPDEARNEWIHGSHCGTWSDHQTKRLLLDRKRLAENGGWNQAWTYGYVYFERSDAAAQLISDYAKSAINDTSIDDRNGLNLRYATICNGSLLRDGSRSINVGRYGAAIVEFATYPKSLANVPGFKPLWIARTSMVAHLRQFRLVDEAIYADQCLKQNEAWRVNVLNQNSEENIRNLCLVSIGFATLPGSLLLCAIAGLLTLASLRIAKRLELFEHDRFSVVAVLVMGIVVSAAVFAFTRIWPIALSAGASLLFLIVSPKAPRKLHLRSFGPFFSFCTFTIWLLCSSALTLFFIATSTAAEALLPNLGPTGEYLADSKLFLATSIAMASLMFLVAPMWSLVRRQPTPLVLAAGLERFGMYLAFGSLGLVAIIGPLAVYGDRRASVELEQIVANEPRYYQGQPF
jgi:hypothetical protein